MEIRIRTAEEFRAAHMTIEITGTGAEVRELAESNYPSELDWAAVRAERDTLWETLARREKEIDQLKGQIAGYDHDRHTERDRADRERQRASELKDRLSSSEERVAGLESELANAQTQRDSLVAERERSADNHNALADRVRELGRSLASSRELVAFKDDVIANIQKDLEAVQEVADREKRRADAAELKFSASHVCVGLCTENNHVSSLGRETLMKAENKVAELTRRIDNARVLLSSPEVKQAQGVDCTRTGTTMSAAIIKALETLA
jgi:chromosome segregation ATPase